MSEMPGGTTSDKVEVGALLVLLHGADPPFRSVQASYRIWRHEERLREAFVADAEEQKRLGASISTITMYGSEGDDPEPPEHEETVRVWRDGERFREEHHGGQRDGYYGVADGSLWWLWDERMGAMSNQDDPSVGSGVGQELEVMFNPTPLFSSLRFRVTGSSEVAGRPTVTADAIPRSYDPRYGRSLGLHQLGTGAHRYQLEVDQERGVLLAVVAIRGEQPFHEIAALAIRFDEPIAADIFQFTRRRRAKQYRPQEMTTDWSTSRSPKRSSEPRSRCLCQIACRRAGRCTACSSKLPNGRHHGLRSRSTTALTTGTKASRSTRSPRVTAHPTTTRTWSPATIGRTRPEMARR